MNMKEDAILTDPEKLVRLELKHAGFDPEHMQVPKRVYLLADGLYDAMLESGCGTYRYPLGGKLYVFRENEDVGFVKGYMCSPAIATQAEDLIAGGVRELIHIGFAGGIRADMHPGEIVLTDGAFHDTAVAGLYGYGEDCMEPSRELTDELEALLSGHAIPYQRGRHWTTDAGYRETWGKTLKFRQRGALCVEMEGAGLFTIAKYRNCRAAAMYIISDILSESGWNLGWEDHTPDRMADRLIEVIAGEIAQNRNGSRSGSAPVL